MTISEKSGKFKQLSKITLFLTFGTFLPFYLEAAPVSVDLSGNESQVLIFPYYTVNAGFQSVFTIKNNSNNYKAIKLRFHESSYALDVLDFNAYLAPSEDFIFNFSQDSSGSPKLSTSDSACTHPKIPASGKTFVTDAYTLTSSMSGREGFVEVIEMGTITNTQVNNGIFSHSCSEISTAWENGTFTQGGSKSVSGYYGDVIPENMAPPTGGLNGSSELYNVVSGITYSIKPIGISNYSANAQHYRSDDANFYQLPSLASGSNTTSKDQNGIVKTWDTTPDYGLKNKELLPNPSVATGINPYPISHVLNTGNITIDYNVSIDQIDLVLTRPMRQFGIFSTGNYQLIAPQTGKAPIVYHSNLSLTRANDIISLNNQSILNSGFGLNITLNEFAKPQLSLLPLQTYDLAPVIPVRIAKTILNIPPTATFTATPTSGSAALTVNLDASASSDANGTIATYAWTSSEGTVITNGKTSSVIFNQAGTFTLTLTVTDNQGATGTATKQVTVQTKPVVNQAPTASFTTNPLSGNAPLNVNVNATASSDPDGRVAAYSWSTSDGKSSNDLVTTFAFNQAGTYSISLTVTDEKGVTGTTSKQITVQSTTPTPPSTNNGSGTGIISGYLSDRCKAYDSTKPVSIHFSGPKTLDQQSDDRGRYFLTLPVGEYQLTIDDPAYTHYSNTVQIKANFHTSTDISLASASGCTNKDLPASSYKAIIVLGSGPDIGGLENSIWQASQDLTEQAYATLRAQGFNDDDIQYLTADDLANVSNPKIDGHLDKTSLQHAITQWAGGVQDVMIYVVSHGGSASLSLNRSQIMRADELNGWLEQLQSKISGKLTVVLEACYSGSFLDPLKRSTNRIVMSSSDKDQLAEVNDANNVSFSYGFWSKLAKHGRLLDAYIDGGLAVANSTTGNTTGYQRALLDSNGDGIYSKEDKQLVQDYCIGGCKSYASDAPVIESVGPAVELNGETSLTVSMQVNSLQPITKAWVNILRPDYKFPNGVAISDLPQVTLTCNATGNCQGTYTQFNKQGNYNLNFYAQDKEGGLATPRSLQLYQSTSSTIANNTVYDATTQVLTIQDVLYNNQHYYAELKNLGNYQFALQKRSPYLVLLTHSRQSLMVVRCQSPVCMLLVSTIRWIY